MKRSCWMLVLATFCASGCGSNALPSAPSPTRESFATALAGTYALTMTLDERCSMLSKSVWNYRAVLANGGGGYLSVQVRGDGYSEPAMVGQIYTFADQQRATSGTSSTLICRSPPLSCCSTARATRQSETGHWPA
jgi:hypothetical protein